MKRCGCGSRAGCSRLFNILVMCLLSGVNYEESQNNYTLSDFRDSIVMHSCTTDRQYDDSEIFFFIIPPFATQITTVLSDCYI